MNARRSDGNTFDTGSTSMTLVPLREEVSEALERLARMLLQAPANPAGRNATNGLDGVRDTVRLLGQVAAGWSQVPAEAFLPGGAGYGSTVTVEDAETGGHETYTLMAGALLDFEGGQVSLASPIGQALLGTVGGEVVTVDTPQRRRRLRVLAVRTLRDLIEDSSPPA